MGFKNEKALLVLLLIIVAFAYKGIVGGFFQQDEWFSFTIYFLNRNLNFIDALKFFFAPNIGHYNPLTGVVQHTLFSAWGMNYSKFAVLGLALHLLVVAAFYFLAKLIFKGNKILAFSSALLFGVLAAPNQAVSWVVADISTLSSSLLGIVSSILFFVFLKKEEGKYLIWSLIVLGVSLLFKEITIGLFPLFFVIGLFKRKNKIETKHFLWIAFSGVFYILLRVAMFFAPNVEVNELVTQSQSTQKLIYNLTTLPLKVLSQTVFPSELIKITAGQTATILPERLTGIPGSPEFEIFVVKRVMEVLSLSIAFLIIIFSRRKNIILLGLGWAILNSFIFFLAPEQPNVIFVVDSRNLYFASIGVAVFIIATLHFYSKANLVKFFLLLLPILFFNIYWLGKNLSQFTERGEIRRYILNEITEKHPDLPERVVFYTESDISYYGLPENEKIFPFQSGLGQTLLVWYNRSEAFPDEFFENRFLWEIVDQGYIETGDRGFGYFRDLGLFKKTIEGYNLSEDSVIAFKWNSKTNSLTDITEEIRKRLWIWSENIN